MKNYTVEAAADLLGIAPASLRKRIADKKIQATREYGDTGRYLISEEALDTYIKYRERYPNGHK